MEPYKGTLEMQLYKVLSNGSKYDYHELKIYIDERNFLKLNYLKYKFKYSTKNLTY